jgi:hypothetical protein
MAGADDDEVKLGHWLLVFDNRGMFHVKHSFTGHVRVARVIDHSYHCGSRGVIY